MPAGGGFPGCWNRKSSGACDESSFGRHSTCKSGEVPSGEVLVVALHGAWLHMLEAMQFPCVPQHLVAGSWLEGQARSELAAELAAEAVGGLRTLSKHSSTGRRITGHEQSSSSPQATHTPGEYVFRMVFAERC